MFVKLLVSLATMPLQPCSISVADTALTPVIIDCVGGLPKTRSECEYILLVIFFTLFGLPKGPIWTRWTKLVQRSKIRGRTQTNIRRRWTSEEGRQMTVEGRQRTQRSRTVFKCKKIATFSNVLGGAPDERSLAFTHRSPKSLPYFADLSVPVSTEYRSCTVL